ncbi:MAG TPA: ABC transporter [Croceibacterium sp.]|nr:ABC transporter [Croceibacterium sp.]
MLRSRGLEVALTSALLTLAAACGAQSQDQRQGSVSEATSAEQRPVLGLMGTIPIYWGESGSFGDLVDGTGDSHWVRDRIEKRFAIEPLDMLTDQNLAPLDMLLLAQPRALGAPENVALDAWVRGGGRLLLFADPMLTGESRYAIGDRRRPQDVILLSPILLHWGLDLQFDVDRPGGVETARADGVGIPIDRAGLFTVSPDGGCQISGGGVLARCLIGKGKVIVLADAALLDLHHPPPGAPEALDWLFEQAFGEIAGNNR